MLKGISSKLRKMTSKSSSKDHVSISFGDDVPPSGDVRESEILRVEGFNPLHRSRVSPIVGSSRGSTRGRNGNRGKSPEVVEAKEEEEDFVEADDVDLRDDIP